MNQQTFPSTSLRRGDWKLIEFHPSGIKELYNLENDIGERKNLYHEMPDKAAEGEELIRNWKEETNAPAYRNKKEQTDE